MQQPWEQGTAARDVSYDANPFQPVDYRQRLSAAPAVSDPYPPNRMYGASPLEDASAAPQPAPWAPPGPLAPGTPYGAPSYPAAPSYGPSGSSPENANPYAPPYGTDAAQSYAQPQEAPWSGDPGWGGVPFFEDAFQAAYPQDPAYPLPGQGYDQQPAYPQDPAYSRPGQGYDQQPAYPQDPAYPLPGQGYDQQPAYPQDPAYSLPGQGAAYSQEPVYSQPEPEWIDPFTPARGHEEEDAPSARPTPAVSEPKVHERPKLRPARVAAVCAAALMLLFCLLVGGRSVMEIAANERELAQMRDSYRERTGTELGSDAAGRVELLPAGQTYVPAATPTPTMYAATPVPSPIIPINEAAIASLNGRETTGAADQPQQAIVGSARTRLTSYPKNPLRNVQESLTALLAQNADVVGHLVIPDVLDEVVLQRNNTYYLNHTLLGTSSNAGSVFADESCSLRMPPENLLLRGIGSVPNQVFSPLWQFISGGSSFAAAHTSAQLTTLYEDERYFLIAVLVAGSDPRGDNYFNYASHPTFTTDEAMLSYVESLRQHSLYDFGVDVQATDRLLTLSTLGDDNSLVLVYRMAREGE